MPRGHYLRPSAEERFWECVDVFNGPVHPIFGRCWVWTAGMSPKGYGTFWLGTPQRAHRVSWSFLHGPIPDGKQVLHHCDNPSCVRPRHLFLGSGTSNMEDRDRKGRQARGERQGIAKLNTSAVRKIRKLRDAFSQSELAELFGVCRDTIYKIQNRTAWGHVR